MKDYINQIKYGLSKIQLREIGFIIFIALFVNHFTQANQFPLDPSYQFPLVPIGFTIIVGLLITLIAKINFQRFKRQYFSKKITTKNLLLFFGTTQGFIALFYLPAYLLTEYLREGDVVIYNFLIGILLTLLLCSIYLFFIFSKPIYELHKWTIIDGKLKIKRGEKTILLQYADIAYFYSREKVVYVVKTDTTKLSTDFTLSQLETILSDDLFFRLNRKIIAHFQSVTNTVAIENGKLQLQLIPEFGDKDASSIIVSRYKKQAFQNWLQKKLQ